MYKQSKGVFSLYEEDESGNLSIELQGVRYELPKPPHKSDFLFSTKPKAKQKWERHELPVFSAKDIIWAVDAPDDPQAQVDWGEARRQEIIIQTGFDPRNVNARGEPKRMDAYKPNPKFCIEVLDVYRERELDRCCPWTDGVWMMINGLGVYLTPYHYSYLQWAKNDNGYPDFYWEEAKVFYHWQYVKESDTDLGRCEGSQRGRGKSARMAHIANMEAIWNENAHVTGQGRNDDDMEDFFKMKIVPQYKNYPDFLIPTNANSTDPTVQLKYSPPSKSGKNAFAHADAQKEALNSVLDYNKAGEKACDRLTLKFYYVEEPGKTPLSTANILTRHGVARECVWRNSKKVGNMYYCTTVEDADTGGAKFKELWDDSNPNKRDANGQTKSGLIHYFLSALTNTYFDDYGFSDIEKSRAWIYNRRSALEKEPDKWRQFVRKFPTEVREMFMFGSGGGHFNESILSERQIALNNPDFKPTRRIKFFQKEDRTISWTEYEDAPWEVSWLPDEVNVKSNNYVQGNSPYFMERVRQESLIPKNTFLSAGVDPVSHITQFLADEKKGSDNACTIRMKYHPAVDEKHHGKPVAIYRDRTNDPDDAYQQMMWGLMFYGVRATCESNKQDFIKYLFRVKMSGFIKPKMGTERSLEPHAGEASSGSEGGLINFYTGRIKSDVERNGMGYNHLQLINELFDFDPSDTKKYDVVVSFGLSLLDIDTDYQEAEEPLDLKELGF